MATEPEELDPTEGFVINCVPVNSYIVQASLKASQLFKMAGDPRNTEHAASRQANAGLESLYRIRAEVQRMFKGAKAENVKPYAHYIVAASQGQDGVTPPIVLYTQEMLRTVQKGGMLQIQVPWDAQLTAIDGETQLAARYEAANIRPETKEEFVGVMICHGKPYSWAQQAFHDLNTLGVKVNAALAIGMDARDPLTNVTREIEKHVPFFHGRLNKIARQLGKNDTEVVTITALRGACVTFAEGIAGIKHGAKPVYVDPKRIDGITQATIDWFLGVTEVLGPAMEDRERTLAAAPAVLAAIGAMGHDLLEMTDSSSRNAAKQRLLDRLRVVNWQRGPHWEGIAGKFTPKGKFSIGGTKETAYAVYSALADETSPSYLQVRGGSPSGSIAA